MRIKTMLKNREGRVTEAHLYMFAPVYLIAPWGQIEFL